MSAEKSITSTEMATAFNEWMRQFTENPEQFLHEFQSVQDFLTDQQAGRTPSYGETCTSLMFELRDGALVAPPSPKA